MKPPGAVPRISAPLLPGAPRSPISLIMFRVLWSCTLRHTPPIIPRKGEVASLLMPKEKVMALMSTPASISPPAAPGRSR